MNWDEYEPESADEYDLCGYCKRGEEHTVRQHTLAVQRARKADARRKESLYKYARCVYDSDRE